MNKRRSLLLDEGFGALDPGTRKDMQRLIRQLWRDTGITVLFVTHNTQEALYLSSRVIVLAKEAPDRGSRIALELPVPELCPEVQISTLVMRRDFVSAWSRAPEGPALASWVRLCPCTARCD